MWTIIVYSVLATLCLSTSGVRAAEILFVTHEDNPLDALDAHIVTFLEELGHTVTLIDDDTGQETTQAAATEADVVFMSESVNETFMWNKITAIETPMIIAEASAWVEMGLTLGDGGLSAVASTDIEIVKSGHFLAAGLRGIVQVLNSTGSAHFGMGIAGAQATVIARATLSDGRTYDVIYVYEKGAALPVAPTDGSAQVAAEMRICFGFDQMSIVQWNDNTYSLLQAAVDYAIGATDHAFNPDPFDEQDDVSRDVIMSWTPGEDVQSHNLYFGTTFEDVNSADASSPLLVGPGIDSNTFDPGRLEYGQTYYWRVDEIGAPEIFKGNVWSFTVEPFARAITADSITATASSSLNASSGPEKTVDQSGLNDLGQHDTTSTNMWTSGTGQQPPVWIQYEFDTAYKLHQMWVWNSNYSLEWKFGLGVKTATIEYSTDDTTWTVLANVPEFAQAPGTDDYDDYTTVDFGSVAAKFVRMTFTSSWGGRDQYALSEVRFMSIPVNASEPDPEDGATEVARDVTLGWRAGREAAEHNVYISDDKQAVIDGTAPLVTVSQTAFGPLSLDLASTYYWRVDEVNNTNTVPVWEGGTWSFTTRDYLVVDDFESYNDIPEGQEGSNLVYLTWIDGYDNPSVNGSTMGYPTGTSMETTTVHGGRQSVPVMYDNHTASTSEVTANASDLVVDRDWTFGSPEMLVVWFYGDPNNPATDRMYVKVNGVKVIYNGSLTQAQWQEFSVDLASLGINLNNVATLTIGFERIGAVGSSGMVFIDDIWLYTPAVAQ
jgi:hypothetical protein